MNMAVKWSSATSAVGAGRVVNDKKVNFTWTEISGRMLLGALADG